MRNKVAARWQDRFAVVGGVMAVLSLAACGPSGLPLVGGLSDGDKRVCADAVQGDGLGVVMDGPRATNSDIQQQAAHITWTSPPEVDQQAIQAIVHICKNHGYRASASGNTGSAVSVNSGSIGPQANGPTSQAATPGSQATARFRTPPAHGILECSIAPVAVTMVDPSTGAVIWSESIAPPIASDWSATGCGNATALAQTPPYDMETFSTDFRREAASNANGHVGWIDAVTGAVTDVTQLVPAAAPAFGQALSVDSNAIFSPKDNSFWFERRSGDGAVTVLRLPDGGSHAETVTTMPADRAPWAISASGHLVGYGALLTGFSNSVPNVSVWNGVSVNPSASAAIVCGWIGAQGPCFLASPLDSQWQNLTLTGPDASGWETGSGRGVLTWVTDTTLIGQGQGRSVEVLRASGGSLSTSSLIADSEASSSAFVVGPDGKTAVFIGTTPATPAPNLYRIALDAPGSQPVQIGPISNSDASQITLLAWR